MKYKDKSLENKLNKLMDKVLKEEFPILRVGDGASGKTTLMKSLLDERYYKPLIFDERTLLFDEEKSVDELLDEGKSLREISKIYKEQKQG